MKKLSLKKKGRSERTKRVRAIVPQVAQRFRKPSLQQQTEAALSNVPRITNETVAEHREEVLKGARKYKYPLEHSKRRIIIVSSALLVTALIGFFVYTGLSLYRYQSTSLFMYRVTQILPFPAAKAGGRWVSYESYLFELRRVMHYYETQQQVDFTSESGKRQLETYRPRALQQVISFAYVKDLAAQNNIRVTQQEITDAVNILRTQNQLAAGDDELEAVMQKFFGWSLGDLRRQLKDELLAQKVAAKLDKPAFAKAQNVIVQLNGGADFVALAAQASDDVNTKSNGGQYNDTAITMKSQEVPPQIVRELGKLQPGTVSGIITTPTSFEVVKLLGKENGTYKAAHIQITFSPIESFIQPLEKKNPPKKFISVELPK
ncbi:peptidylprolyl isomerase [Candidatus Saccharibacteria bacterium]|nr:MAG: peptidylprolyl isomerase [Candidatus Saccharibacteria bacterium]